MKIKEELEVEIEFVVVHHDAGEGGCYAIEKGRYDNILEAVYMYRFLKQRNEEIELHVKIKGEE